MSWDELQHEHFPVFLFLLRNGYYLNNIHFDFPSSGLIVLFINLIKLSFKYGIIYDIMVLY